MILWPHNETLIKPTRIIVDTVRTTLIARNWYNYDLLHQHASLGLVTPTATLLLHAIQFNSILF